MHKGLQPSTSRGRVIPLGDGRHIEVRPMGLRDLAQLEEQALADYKRGYLETFTKNADMMPAEHAADWLRDAFQRAALLSVESLPARVQANGQPIPYAFWWASESLAGMLHAVWLSVRKSDPSLKFDDLDELLGNDYTKLTEIANAVGELSSPTEGNGRPPADKTAPAAKEAMTNQQPAPSAGQSSSVS